MSADNSFNKLAALSLCCSRLNQIIKESKGPLQALAVSAAEETLAHINVTEITSTSGDTSADNLREKAMFVCEVMALGTTQRKVNSAHISNLERDVLYRSDFLLILFKYLELLDYSKEIEVSEGKILGLFCFILKQRLMVIDDKEFLGERQLLLVRFLDLQ